MVDDVAARIAQRTSSRRTASYAEEVRRLLDAALAVIRERGTSSRPRVQDIVAAAGLSNDAFYRHFASKDALVAALLEDGAARLRSYLEHQLAKETAPAAQVRRWVEGVLAQAADDTAATTRAVLWNGGSVPGGMASGRHWSVPVGDLLAEPFRLLGSSDPQLDARLASHAVLGRLADHLWQETRPTAQEVERTTAFCLAAVHRPVEETP